MWHRGSKPVTCRFLTFWFSHMLHWPCSKMLLTQWNYLFSNKGCARLIISLVYSDKIKLKVTEYSCHPSLLNPLSYYSEIFLGIIGIYSESDNPNGIKIGSLLRKLGWIHSHNTELKNKLHSLPLSPISASSAISRKRQTTGFEPLRHKCVLILNSFI